MGDNEFKCPAGVYVRSAAGVEIHFAYKGVRCRETLRLDPKLKRNIQAAANTRARILAEIRSGEFDYAKHFPDSPRVKHFNSIPGADITIKEYLTTWLAKEERHVRRSTWRGYQSVVKGTLIPAFGDLTLTDLKRPTVATWIEQRDDLTVKTMKNVLSPLRVALADAVEKELIPVNLFWNWQIKWPRDTKATNYVVDPFSMEERDAIIAAASDPQWRNWIRFAFWTGLRTSELCGLSWPQIDWVHGMARIEFVLTCGFAEDGPEKNTKTDAGVRDVKLLPSALEALKAQKVYTYIKGQEVFQNPISGDRWQGANAIHYKWVQTLRKAGVRYRNQYQTRHTYASMMLMAGEDRMWVAQQMGHSDWALTARMYSRWIPDDAPEAGKKAVERWTKEGGA